MIWRLGLAGDERGVAAIEYGLIASLIALAMMEGLSSLGGGVAAMWAEIVREVQGIM